MNQLETTWSPADHFATWPAKPAYPNGEPVDKQPGAPRSVRIGCQGGARS